MSLRAGLWLALLVPLSVAAGAAAEDTLLGCRKVDAPEQRLACYDRVVDRARLEITPGAPEGEPRASSSEPTEQDDQSLRERLFGRPPAESARALHKTYGVEAPQEIASNVTAAELGADRQLVITLENGQVWRQAEYTFFPLHAGDSVGIKAGLAGSYHLRRNGRGRTIRVKRIR